ncbi:MAG: phosphopantothenoylcysteine decarboxylase [Phycisphaerae bacterium]|nr:phosphopantothenoylcysteine decarboxylase [Phycisphaerae bacterium]
MRILITAGPTREFFDTVRFISNPSSGKMGYALAAAAARRGHRVVLVSGPVSIAPPKGVALVRVVSAAEMAAAAKRAFRQADAGIFTAAVCDYRPQQCLARKLKKQHRARVVKLEPTEDIAMSLGQRKGCRITIGFAMEDHDARRHAADKLTRKRCDVVVLNGPENIGADWAAVEVLLADGEWLAPWQGTKRQLAGRIIRLTETLHAAKRGRA